MPFLAIATGCVEREELRFEIWDLRFEEPWLCHPLAGWQANTIRRGALATWESCETLSRGERWYAVPKGDLRFEETSDYQASDGRLSDRSVANTFPDNRGRLRSAGGFLDSVKTLHRVPKSAEVGPRRTMVRFISLLTIVHPLPLRGVHP